MAGPPTHFPPRPTYHLCTAYTPPRQSLARTSTRHFIQAAVLLLLILSGNGLFAQAQPDPHAPDTAKPTQHSPDTAAADLARTGILDNISNICFVYFSPEKNISPDSLPFLSFPKEAGKFKHYILPARVNTTPIIRFALFNSSDSVQSVFLCPGFFFDAIQIFQQPFGNSGPGVVRELPAVMPDDKDSLGYRKITLPPHGRSTYFVKLSFIRSPTNVINPSITREVFIKKGITLNHRDKTDIDIMTNLFAGIMLSAARQANRVEFIK